MWMRRRSDGSEVGWVMVESPDKLEAEYGNENGGSIPKQNNPPKKTPGSDTHSGGRGRRPT
ncbi:hypothetical protein GCM10022631_12250 [Deinococcus rubellus]